MELGIITPTNYLENIATESKYHLVLAHMVERDSTYREFYKNRSKHGDYITLDNSSYEMGDDVYTPDQLIELAHMVGAKEVMAPEQFQDGQVTISKVEEFVKKFYKKSKLSVFATIHGKDFVDAYLCFVKCMELGVDTIGLSCRLDFQIFEQPYNKEDEGTYRRTQTRMNFLRQIYNRTKSTGVQFHMLGLNHPYEFFFYKGLEKIRSHDSSAYFLAGCLGKQIWDSSYTKPTIGLDFDMKGELTMDQLHLIDRGIEYVREIVQ